MLISFSEEEEEVADLKSEDVAGDHLSAQRMDNTNGPGNWSHFTDTQVYLGI